MATVGDARIRVGAEVDSASLQSATNALDSLSIGIKGVGGSSAGFSADVLALNPGLAALVSQSQSAAAATQALADTQNLAATATLANTGVISAQSAAVQDLSALYAGLDGNVKNVVRDIGDLGRAPIPEPKLGSIVSGLGEGGGATTGETVSKIGRAVFNAPALGPSTPIARALVTAGPLIDKAGLSIAQLGVGVGVFGGAVALAYIGLQKAITAIQDADAAERARAKLIADTAREVANDSTQELTERRARAQQELALEQENNAKLLAERVKVHDEFNASLGLVNNTGKSIAELIGNITGNDADIVASNTALADAQKKIDAYTHAIQDNAAAAGDVIDRLGRVSDIQRTRVDLSGSGDVEGAQQKIKDFTVDIGATGQELGDITLAIADARAHGNEVEASTLDIERIRLEGELDLALSNKALYESMLPVIQANAALQLSQANAARVANANANAQLEADNLTESGRRDRIAAINREIAVLQSVSKQPGLSDEDAKALSDRIRNLGVEKLVLDAVNESEADRIAAINAQLSVISDSISYQQQLASAIRTSTVEQTADRLQGLADEKAAILAYLPELERLAPTSTAAAQALEDARMRLGQIGDDFADLTSQVLPQALARAYNTLVDDLNAIQSKSEAALQKINDDQTAAEQKAAVTRNEAYTNAQEKRDEALTSLAEKQAADREKIERKANVSIQNAIYSRNALQAYLAIEQKKQDLADLAENGRQRAADIDKQYAKDRAQADKNYDKARRDAQQAADKALAAERKRANDELNARINAYNRQIGILDTFTSESGILFDQFRVNGLSAIGDVADAISRLGSGIGSGGVVGFPPVGSGSSGSTGGVATPLPSSPTIGQRFIDAVGDEWQWTGTRWTRVGAGTGVRQGFSAAPPLPPLTAPPPASLIAPPAPARGSIAQQPITRAPTPIFQMLASQNTRPLTINLGGIHGSQLSKRDIQQAFHKELDKTLTAAGIV